MNIDEYIQTSKEKRLKESFCPISHICERKKVTLKNFRYEMHINDEDLVKLKGQPVRFFEHDPSDIEDIQGFRNICPEVTLLSEVELENQHLAGFALSDNTVTFESGSAYPKDNSKHYSDCLEYKMHEYDKENGNSQYSLNHYNEKLKEKITTLINNSEYDSAIRACFVILSEHLRDKFNIDGDGEKLINKVFSPSSNYFNNVKDKTAYRNLFSGFYGVFRNYHAHHVTNPSLSETLSIAEMTNHLIKTIDENA